MAMALAGCSGGGDAVALCDGGPCDAAPSGEGTIRGQVLTEEGLPVPEADVGLRERNQNTTTDASGRFAFTGIPDGTYTLDVAKLGFESSGVQISLTKGEAAETTVRLAAIATATPHTEVLPFSGRFECSYALADTFWHGCGYPAHSSVFPSDTNLAEYDKGLGATQIVHELSWEATSLATGSNLDFSVVQGGGREGCQWYANAFGPSPIRIQVTVGEQFENADSPYPTGTCGDNVVNELDKNLGVLILSSPTYAGGVATAGLTLQQSFEGFVSVFYHQEAPADYSALPDA
jgi:hypothetical protein